jgi:DNA-binding GntR family transcriptional regulator
MVSSRYTRVVPSADGIDLVIEFPFRLTLGLAQRKKQARRRIHKALAMERVVDTAHGEACVIARFGLGMANGVRHAADTIEKSLTALAAERLTPKAVEEALGISSKERIRWTKEGRLPRSGTGTFKKGAHVFQHSLHPADKIADLAENPAVIASWRARESKAT